MSCLQGALLTAPSEWIQEWLVAREPHLSEHGRATEHVLHGWLYATSLRRCAYDQKGFCVPVNACIHTGGVSLEGTSILQSASSSEAAQSLLHLCVYSCYTSASTAQDQHFDFNRAAPKRAHTHTHTHTYEPKRLASTGTYVRFAHTWRVQQPNETHSS